MSTKIDKIELQDELKQIMDQLKETYFEFLSSLKFQNINQKQQYKAGVTMLNSTSSQTSTGGRHHSSPSTSGYAGHNMISMIEQQDQFEEQNISEIQQKNFNFQEEMAIQNKGYLAFIRLIGNIKQLQDYNNLLRLMIMNNDPDTHLTNRQNQMIQGLQRLQVEIPNIYLSKPSTSNTQNNNNNNNNNSAK